MYTLCNQGQIFPILILLIFFIFGGFELGMLVGVIYGFLYGLFLKRYLIISDDTFTRLENGIFSNFTNLGGFIKMSEVSTSKQQPFIGNFTQNNNEQNDSESYSDDSDSNNFQNKLKKFNPFSGKGITLGTDKH